MLFDRICRENGIIHRLTAPRSPTMTGEVERFHKTLRVELLDGFWARESNRVTRQVCSVGRRYAGKQVTVQVEPSVLHVFCEGIYLKTIPRTTTEE